MKVICGVFWGLGVCVLGHGLVYVSIYMYGWHTCHVILLVATLFLACVMGIMCQYEDKSEKTEEELKEIQAIEDKYDRDIQEMKNVFLKWFSKSRQ